MNGVFVVDKPLGPTSHDVVARVRRSTGLRRIGHTGTLDPLATGVLPLVVGRATRLASLLAAGPKAYDAHVRFGVATATYDAEPRLVPSGCTTRWPPPQPPPPEPTGLSREVIEEALQEFRGTFWQAPPPFSAKKIAGVRSYERARRQETTIPQPGRVTVHSLRLEEYVGGLARLQLICSPGFYVRSLAHDLGQRLGCGAHLEALRRTRSGEFELAQAVPLEVLETEGPHAVERLVPLDRLLPHLPAAVLTERGVRLASHGNPVSSDDFTAAEVLTLGARDQRQLAADPSRWRLLDTSGALLGIGQPAAGGFLHPVIVLV